MRYAYEAGLKLSAANDFGFFSSYCDKLVGLVGINARSLLVVHSSSALVDGGTNDRGANIDCGLSVALL